MFPPASSLVFVVTSSDQNTSRQTGANERAPTLRLMFWFAVIQVIIRCSRPRVNHGAPLNYSCLYILFMTLFSHATWKFAEAGLPAETELPKHFIETGPLSSRTQAGKAVGCGVHILQTSLIIYIYIASIVSRSWIFFFICKTFTLLSEKIQEVGQLCIWLKHTEN